MCFLIRTMWLSWTNAMSFVYQCVFGFLAISLYPELAILFAYFNFASNPSSRPTATNEAGNSHSRPHSKECHWWIPRVYLRRCMDPRTERVQTHVWPRKSQSHQMHTRRGTFDSVFGTTSHRSKQRCDSISQWYQDANEHG